MVDVHFKPAESSEEIEQVHCLNHRIFAEEVGQHPRTADGRLIDKFHSRNRYFLAKVGSEVVGMVSAHDGPEFSIAGRLKDITALKALRAPLEIRLLAILPRFRKRSILTGLFWQVRNYARIHHYSDLLISGIIERLPMYEKMGFRAMGPAVACGGAAFVPMRLSLDAASERFEKRERMYGDKWRRSHATSLLPGPVEMSKGVIDSFHEHPISHRAQQFIELYEEMRRRLGDLMGGLEPVVLCGSGTLTNDAIAANLRCAFGDAEGLVIANGEFGDRLIRQAACAGLNYRALQFRWGEAWSLRKIESELERRPKWVWAVHLETSTGVLNDLQGLTDLASQHGAIVAADCVSSLGAVDTRDIGRRLFLASGVSGKALGSYAGLGFVFISPNALDQLTGKIICPTFDLVAAVRSTGPVSTLPSPLVKAALQALRENYDCPASAEARYLRYQQIGIRARAMMREAGLELLSSERDAAPTIATFPMPSAGFAQECRKAGFRIAHESDYLRTRGWGQIATMGNLHRESLEALFAALKTREASHHV